MTRALETLLDDLIDAVCDEGDMPTFFLDDPSEAKDLCAICPVISACRRYGDWIERGIAPSKTYGVLAGESPAERVNRRRREKRNAA